MKKKIKINTAVSKLAVIYASSLGRLLVYTSSRLKFQVQILDSMLPNSPCIMAKVLPVVGKKTVFKPKMHFYCKISHFQVTTSLCFKARLSAKPLTRKWFFPYAKKTCFHKKCFTPCLLESERFWNSEMANSDYLLDVCSCVAGP